MLLPVSCTGLVSPAPMTFRTTVPKTLTTPLPAILKLLTLMTLVTPTWPSVIVLLLVTVTLPTLAPFSSVWPSPLKLVVGGAGFGACGVGTVTDWGSCTVPPVTWALPLDDNALML